jgi:DHA3 family macrolide efflux protein-like MFS transporter
VLLAGIVLGLIVGLLLGGRLDNLVDIRLRWAPAIVLAVIIRFATELSIREGVAFADQLRLPLYALSFGLLFTALWLNRDQPGLLVAATGVLANGVAIVANGGWMPVWQPALELAGFGPEDLVASFHTLLPDQIGLPFLLRAGPFGDLIPIPFPPVENVASVGDIFLSVGIGWFVFSTLVRTRFTAIERPIGFGSADLASGPGSAAAGALEQPIMLGGSPAAATVPAPRLRPSRITREVVWAPTLPAEAGVAPAIRRIRTHPYIRLALDARFSAFWLGQTISLFGDRLHQIALGVLVFGATGSPALTGFVFVAATLPNFFLGPIAGTFVDRWDQKTVMIVSDLLRAGLVLLLPIVALEGIGYVYPLVFAITAVSLFFRPAKAAVVPRIVRSDELMAANSATWMSDTLADLMGYPLAGLFVYFLGRQVGLAFWADAATYIISAILILGISIPPVVRVAGEHVQGFVASIRTFFGELRDGWAFLRRQPVLFQNTLISAIAQTSIGATIGLAVVYASNALDQTILEFPRNWAAIEFAIGLGNLVGGLAVGAAGAALRKGWLVVAGFIAMGLATVLLGLTGNVLVAIVAATIIGAANLVYIVPTQTLFAELTPPEMMGRVVSFRSMFVYGALTGAMGVSAVVADSVPVGLVIAGFGAITAASGFLAALLPAVRDAR